LIAGSLNHALENDLELISDSFFGCRTMFQNVHGVTSMIRRETYQGCLVLIDFEKFITASFEKDP